MEQEKILVIGALGQLGSELTVALRDRFGPAAVMAADIVDRKDPVFQGVAYTRLDVLDSGALKALALSQGLTQVYHLAAVLSAKGEGDPRLAWQINMDGLLNVLDTAVACRIGKVFWPSSIAVFGPGCQQQYCGQSPTGVPSTVYGISKLAGEFWCGYYMEKFGLDVRSLRYPGLIGYRSAPGGGTTDYAVDIFHSAIAGRSFECFLREDTQLPMMYMDDAIRATLELMDAERSELSLRSAYNLSGMSFSPRELAGEIASQLPGFVVSYAPDFRQQIADSWPDIIDDRRARTDWGWQPEVSTVEALVGRMLAGLASARPKKRIGIL